MPTTFVFDFDHTLALTGCKAFSDYNDPSFIEHAVELPLTSFAAHISSKAKVKILTARSTAKIGDALLSYCARNGIDVDEVIGVADIFTDVRVAGTRKPRKMKTAEKKALMLARWAAEGTVCFFDDCDKNIAEAEKVSGVITTKVEK